MLSTSVVSFYHKFDLIFKRSEHMAIKASKIGKF